MIKLEERDFKGVWIPKEIWLSKELKIMEKLFLVEIDSLDNDKGCYASNSYFAEFFQLSKNRCSEIIKSLETKKLISIEYIRENGKKNIEKRVIRVFEKSNRGIRETDKPIRNIDKGYSEKCEENNTVINNTSNNKNNKQQGFDSVINLYTDNEELKLTIFDFIKMRKANKKVMTDRAVKLMLNELNKLASNDEIKIAILNQSIQNCWQGVFPLKDKGVTHGGNTSNNQQTSGKFAGIKINQSTITDEEYRELEEYAERNLR